MADVLITRDGPYDAPYGYELGARESFEPTTVEALIDGTGAAGDFKVVCVIRSPDGKVLARVPTSETFTTGDEVAVTFAPFLRAFAQPAVAQQTPMYVARTTENGVGITAMPNMTSTLIGIGASKWTNDLTFTYFTSPSNTAIRVLYPGTYLALGWMLHALQGAYETRCDLSSPGAQGSDFHLYSWGDAHFLSGTSFAAEAMPATASFTHTFLQLIDVLTTPMDLGVLGWQNSGGSINATSAGLALIRIGRNLTFVP